MTTLDAKRFFFALMLGWFPLFLSAADLHKEMKVLSDSAQNMLGQKQLPTLVSRWMQLAREQNDTTQMENAYEKLTAHYYLLGNIDSLKVATYAYMDWCLKCKKYEDRYMQWRQYIQRMTEKGMQEESVAETARLHEDAEKAKNKYGLACGEMCIGYNHRIFSNKVDLCIEAYSNALKLFEAGGYSRDCYVVLINIIQTHLSRGAYQESEKYLNKVQQLEEQLKKENQKIDDSLHLRYCEFRVISLLASKGKEAAKSCIEETDKYYRQNPQSSTPEAWFGYKIMCCRLLGDLKGNIAYVDSLMDYQHSLGTLFPYNYVMKAQLQEQLGDYQAACRSYAKYALVNDSVRKMEFDEQLSKYTAQFEVDRLRLEKLELSAKLTKDRLIIAIVVGGLILVFLLLISYLYYRTLTMNRKLKAARNAVQKMSQVKSSFVQHITHEIRTPLNSIVGFSTLLAEGAMDEIERKDYVAQVESNNLYLLGLMENILTIADMDSQVLGMPQEEVNVEACCTECADSLRPLLKEGVELLCIPSSETSTVYLVRSWLNIVLMALLDNAVKFTEKGRISVSCQKERNDRVLRLIVEDTGIGIKPEAANRIFKRFYKVNTFTKGSGLGLAIAYEVMEMAGGRIYLDEKYRDGCRFIVNWPLVDKKRI